MMTPLLKEAWTHGQWHKDNDIADKQQSNVDINRAELLCVTQLQA